MRAPLVVLALLAAAGPARAADLALKRVMLSSAGVGYYEYAAEVDGAAALGLDVRLDQVDDVLKSLVVFDDAGGVGTVELPGRDQTAAAFGDLPFGPEALASPVAYLNSLRGVSVDVQGPKPMSGRIVEATQGAETVATPGNGSVSVQRTRVTLLSAEGLRQFVLEDADSVQVSDPELRAGIGRALETLRRDADHNARHLTIQTVGKGQRTVRVGFVAVAPLWKASYRVVLPATEATKTARLQGWAVLENATGSDWKGVSLALQYGNPVTFHQAIYRSYFVSRPEVPVEVLGRLLPDVDTQAIPAMPMTAAAPAPPAAADMLRKLQQSQSRSRGAQNFAALVGEGAGSAVAMAAPSETVLASEGADETVFPLASLLDLPAGHSAAVPILDREVPAARIGLLAQNKAHPLSAIRITNDTGETLPAGVLTLYDASGAPFAGDARLGSLPPGQTRLLSFAEDLRTTAIWDAALTTTVGALTASGGVLHYDERQRRTSSVALTAPANEARHLLVEITKQPGTTLVRDLPAGVGVEETAGAWRLAVDLAAGTTIRLAVHVDRLLRQQTSLGEDPDTIVRLIGEQGLTEPERAALRRLVELRRQQTAQSDAKERLEADLAKVVADEDRVRANIGAVTAGDALRTRLVRQLDADETRIAALTKSIADADQAIAQAQKALSDAVAGFRL